MSYNATNQTIPSSMIWAAVVGWTTCFVNEIHTGKYQGLLLLHHDHHFHTDKICCNPLTL